MINFPNTSDYHVCPPFIRINEFLSFESQANSYILWRDWDNLSFFTSFS